MLRAPSSRSQQRGMVFTCQPLAHWHRDFVFPSTPSPSLYPSHHAGPGKTRGPKSLLGGVTGLIRGGFAPRSGVPSGRGLIFRNLRNFEERFVGIARIQLQAVPQLSSVKREMNFPKGSCSMREVVGGGPVAADSEETSKAWEKSPEGRTGGTSLKVWNLIGGGPVAADSEADASRSAQDEERPSLVRGLSVARRGVATRRTRARDVILSIVRRSLTARHSFRARSRC